MLADFFDEVEVEVADDEFLGFVAGGVSDELAAGSTK